jgi:hypothetical protein
MKKFSAVLFWLLITATFSYTGELNPSKMDSFSWLIGKWEMKTGRGLISESWTVVDDSSFAGESSMVRANGEMKLLEKIQFVYRNGSYFYIPTAIGQNNNQPVKFKITTFSGDGFVAENPEHDFPKRIIYNLVNKDSIHAVIDGGASLPNKKSDFYYSRNKN